MANIDRFYIGYLDNNSGLHTDVKPFALPENAFTDLTNTYVFRGRVRKRFGSALVNQSVSKNVQQLHSRLRIKVGTTDAVTGNFTITFPLVPVATFGTVFEIGQMFSIGSTIFTVIVANGATLTTGVATATFDIATRILTIVGGNENPSTDVYFYPSLPVMGLLTYESPLVNDEPVYAFDTQFSYQYAGGGWERLGTALWSGTDYNFFYGCNYRGLLDKDYTLFVVNYNGPDLIKYYNYVTAAWTDLDPIVNVGGGITTKLRSSRLIVAFKKRLIFLNTIEKTSAVGATDVTYVNRIRFSSEGSTTSVNSFRDDIPGNGGLVDAPTKEQIISCGFVQDRLVVYFERSTWELVYSGNAAIPFVFQKLSAELGVESTFSAVTFDKAILGMGNVGIHACNGGNVVRIDQKIPGEIFKIANEDEGLERVYGIRDYFTQMVYWAFCSKEATNKYPDKVLTYNYMTESWGINEDSITVFGYFQKQSGSTWGSSSNTWGESTETWNSGESNARYRNIIAGNQQGFVFIIDPDLTVNATAIQITNIVAAGNILTVTSFDHNFVSGDYIKINSASGTTAIDEKIYKILQVIDLDTFTIVDNNYTGTYKGGGVIARVSNINILTKQYNFYMNQGRNFYISKVDFHLDKTTSGQVTVDSFVGSSYNSQITSGSATNALLGSGTLETSPYVLSSFEQLQERVWHPLYFQADGECIQLRMYMTEAQMLDNGIAESDFQLNSMIFHATPTASRLQ